MLKYLEVYTLQTYICPTNMKHKQQAAQVLTNLKALVEKHGVTHQQLADIIKIRRQSVTGMLNRRFSPTLDKVFEVLNALNEVAGSDYTLKDI